MHVPMAWVASPHHHFEVVGPTSFNRDRAERRLAVDNAIDQGENRPGDYRSHVGGLRRIECVGPGFENFERPGNRHRVADLDHRGANMNVVERDGQVFQERLVGGFAMSMRRPYRQTEDENRRDTDYEPFSHPAVLPRFSMPRLIFDWVWF